MTWYNQNPKWKQFIQKQYNTQQLLSSKDQIELIKQLPLQPELQSYIINNKHKILQDCLKYCLEYPSNESCYNRKFMYPTKAIELLTNQIFFTSLGWDKQLIKMYLNTLFTNFATVDPNYQNINIFHGYFQRLFRMLNRYLKPLTVQILQILDQLQLNGDFVQLLMRFSHKFSVITCLYQLIVFDLIHIQQSTLINVKKSIIANVMITIEQFVKGQSIEEQKVQNCLILLKMYLQQSFHYTKDKNHQFYKQNAASFGTLATILTQKWSYLITILTQRQDNCLKLRVFQILQVYEMQRQKLSSNGFPTLISQSYKQQIISYMFKKPFGIIYSHFYEWLIIAFSNLGENSNEISIFINQKVLEKTLALLLQNKNNNILSFRIFILLKMMFVNIQKEVQLKLSRKINTGEEITDFQLLTEFFKHFSIIQSIVKSFKSYNECLFIHMAQTFKFFTQNAYNIINNFNNFNTIPICNTSKMHLQHLIEFYQTQPCFKLYQTQISKDLGTFFTDDVFKDKAPLQYLVRKIDNLPNTKPSKKQQHQKIKPQTVFTIKEKEVIIPPVIDNSLIQLKFDNKSLEIQQGPKPKQKVQSLTEISIAKENEQDTQQGYAKYLKKNMQQVESIVVQNKRSKSRTPTKMKSECKKNRNKWQDQSEISNSSVNQNESKSDNKVSKTILRLSPQLTKHFSQSNIQKISLIKINKRNSQNRQNKERKIDNQRDSRLCQWLKLLKEIR